MPEAAAIALSEAMRISEENPADFAYPFWDGEAEQVVVTPASVVGLDKVDAARSVAARAARAVGDVKGEERPALASRERIDSIMNDMIGPQAEGITIVAANPDTENGRVILEVSELNDKFLERAARQYGAPLIAVRVSADAGVKSFPAVGRDADNSPFYGGAKINDCTSGFSWHSGSTEMMLTAGHCYPSGGSVSTSASSMGSVRSSSEENWTNGTGTVLMTDETSHRGDLALVRLGAQKSSTNRIYRGGAGSTSGATVAGKWSRSPVRTDQYCTGGRVSGEQCGWRVVVDAPGLYYYNGSGETARKVWRGTKRGHCIQGGDSGGPVYTVNSNGSVAAKGIISGVTGFGGGDSFAGATGSPCVNVFTDVWDAYYSMPGDIN